MPEPDILICMRRADANPRNVVPGSVDRTCCKYGAAVCVSPSCLRHFHNQPVQFICNRCIPPDCQPQILPETLQEIRAYLLQQNRN